MFRKLYVSIEYQDWGRDTRGAQEEVDAFAAEYGLSEGRQVEAEDEEFDDLGYSPTRRYPVGRSRRRAESVCDEIYRYLHECTSLGWIVHVHPPMPAWQRSVRDWLLLFRWTLTHPHDPDRQYNIYLLRYDLTSFWNALIPFARCECGGFVKVFWRARDPHFRDGQWVGPDDCLPF